MCMPHASPKHANLEKKARRNKTPLKPFNKKLLKPDPDFTDERKYHALNEEKKSFFDKLFGT